MKKKYKRVFSINNDLGYRNYTVRDIIQLKGKKKLTQINVTTPEEAAAAEEAGIDLIIAGPPSPMKKIREAAPKTFFTCGLNWTEHESKESVVRKCLELIELGLDSLHCGSWNMDFVKYLSQFRIPIQGHVGLVPMKSTWTGGVKPVGKKLKEAIKIYEEIKELENIGCWAVEVECIPADILAEINKITNMLTISIGSGSKSDVQFLFAEDILGYHNDSSKTPRHAKSYRNFDKIYSTIQKERIKAFKKFQSDVELKKFPLKKHSVLADQKEVIKFKKLITNYNNGNK